VLVVAGVVAPFAATPARTAHPLAAHAAVAGGGALLPPAPDDRPPDPFPVRRVLLPAGKLDPIVSAAARGAFRTLPKDEFESRVSAAARAQLAARTPPVLVRAVYRGGYAPGRITGTADWTVANPGGRAAPLPIDSLKVAVGPAVWSDGGKAVLFRGKLTGHELPGTHLWVEAAGGTASLPWSARAVEEPDEERFELGLPAAPLATLELTLPADRTPTVSPARAFLAGPFPAKVAAERVWNLTFGGLSTVTVSVRRPAAGGAAPLVAARTARYDLAPGEVRATFEFAIDSQRSVRERVFDVDPGLRVESVSGGTRDRWSFEPAVDPKAAGRLTVTFQEPTATARVMVTATAALPAGPQTWAFPGVRASGGLPTADVIEAAVHPDLRFDGWTAGDYRVAVPGVQPDRTLKVQFHGSLTATDSGRRRPPAVRVRPAEPELATEEALDWVVEPDRTRLSARVKVRVTRGPLAAVAVQAGPGYVLDAVTLGTDDSPVPFDPSPEGEGGWRIEPARAVPTGRTAEFRLEFRGPPGPRPADLGDTDPPAVVVGFPRFSLGGVAERQGTLTVTGGGGLRAAPRTVLPATVASPATFAVPFRGREPDGEAVFTPEPPAATLTLVKLSVAGATAAAALHARCEDPPLGGVTVFVPGDGGTVSVHGAEATRLPAVPLLPLLGARSGWGAVAAAGVPAALPGSIWRVRFAQPVRGEFVVSTAYPVPPPDPAKPYPLALPVILGCNSWGVEATLGGGLAEPFLPPATEAVQDAFLRTPPSVTLESAAARSTVVPPDAVWRFDGGRLTSALVGGEGVFVTFSGRLTEAAGRTLPLHLPPGADEVSARVAGKWVPNPMADAGRLGLPLPDVPPGGLPFEVHYRLPVAERWPLPEVRSPAPALPAELAIERRWRLDPERLRWPALDAATEPAAWDTAAVRVARRQVVEGVGLVLAGATAALGVRLVRTGRRGTAVAVAVLVTGLGAALWVAPGGWRGLVRPPFATGVAVLAVTVAVHRRGTPPPAARGPTRSAPVMPLVAGAVVVAAAVPTAAQPPEPVTVYVVNGKDRLTVTAPQAALDRLDALAASPLPAVVLTHAEYAGRAADAVATFDANFTLTCLRDGDHPFALPLAGVRLEQAKLDGRNAYPDASNPDRYVVVVSGKGEHRLTLRFAVVPTATGRDREARFDGPDVPSARVEFRCGVSGRQPDVTTRRGGQEVTNGVATADHGGGRTVAVRWRETAATDVTKPAVTVKEVGVWDVSDAAPAVTAAFAYRIDGGTTDTLPVGVPDGLQLVSVRVIDQRGNGVRGWVAGDGAGGGTAVDVRLQQPTDGRVALVMRAVPTRPLPDTPVLRYPRALVPATDRDGVYGVRFAGVRVDGMALAGAIDFPPDALGKEVAKDFPPVPELALDRAPPERVMRRAGAEEVELRPTLVPTTGLAVAALEVTFTGGPRVEADGAARAAGAETGCLQFDVPAGCEVRDVRAPELMGWARSGTRLQVWLRQPTADLTVRWAGTVPVRDGVAGLSPPRWPAGVPPTDPPVVRIRAADGYAVAPRVTAGWHPKPSGGGDLLYAVDPIAPVATFAVQPLPPPVPKPADPPPTDAPPPPPRGDTAAAPGGRPPPVEPPPPGAGEGHAWWATGGWVAAAWVVAAVWRSRRRWPECWVGLGALAAAAAGVGSVIGVLGGLLAVSGVVARLIQLFGRSGR
jgi:hypothetical protein